MRLRVDQVSLVEGDRTVDFRPGLNVIDGPIATGKTTLLNLCRILLGSRIHNLIPELHALPAVNGRLTIGKRQYAVSRPLVSTPTAVVEVAEIGGAGEGWRLPVRQSTPGLEETYRAWLLRMLGLPSLQVPRAPTQPESDPTPVTIADYLNYCFLTQDEIDNSVIGHRDFYRNIKRRYVSKSCTECTTSRQQRFRIDCAKPPKACEQSQLMKRLWSSSYGYSLGEQERAESSADPPSGGAGGESCLLRFPRRPSN